MHLPLAVLAAAQGPTTAPCAAGWTEADGNCFKYVTTPLTHDQAEKNCQSLHQAAHLATIKSAAQNQAAAELAGSHSEVHIGLTWDNGALRWASGDDVTYEGSWHHRTGSVYRGRSGSETDRCTRLVGADHRWKHGHWDDWSCSKTDNFMCSYTPPLPVSPVKSCATEANAHVSNTQCVFPFTYKGVTYNECTLADSSSSVAWCSTEVTASGA
jgi:hypothetical protein